MFFFLPFNFRLDSNSGKAMDVGELLSFKPATAPKRPAAVDEHELEDEDDPCEISLRISNLFSFVIFTSHFNLF
jgi:hypothetical protein